jgi:hypothetical protein
MLVLAVSAVAEPVFEWVSLKGLSPEMQLRMDHVRRSRCLPQAGDVSLPLYPRLQLTGVNWGRVKPLCELRDGWNALGAVTFVTVDDVSAVHAWYAERLADFTAYTSPRGLVLIRATIENFLWDRDYYLYPNIAISRADSEWDAAGYRTIITFNRPRP